MKRLVLPLVTALVALAAADLWAGEQPGKAGSGGTKAGKGRGGNVAVASGALGGGAAGRYFQYLEKAVELTDEQKAAMTEIIEAREKTVQEFQTQNREKLRAVARDVVDSVRGGDNEAIAKAQRAYLELYAPINELMKTSQAQLNNVLTAEQRAQLQSYQVTMAVKNMTAPVELSDEQIQQVCAACQDTQLIGFGGNLYEAVQKVLRPEQKATILKHRATAYVKSTLGPVKLSTGQSQQVDAACDDLARDLPLNDGKLYVKLGERLRELLTAEQKAAIARYRATSYARAVFSFARLTPDQIKQVAAIGEELVKDETISVNDPEFSKKLAEKVNGLLTEKQQAAMQKARSMGAAIGSGTGSAKPGASVGGAIKTPEAKK